jgi:alpha-amylase/alpha-mannosidase (GH57 family)
MSAAVRVALLWHMHQPSYHDPLSGEFVLPWVRLHALKDYYGMVRVLAETPGVKATFNLVPSLIDQLLAYARGEAREALLDVSLKPAADLSAHEKLLALRGLFMAHRQNLIGRFPRFEELLLLRGDKNDEASLRPVVARFREQDYRDLQVVSKLAWFDLEWREHDAVVRALVEKGRGFGEEDKRALAARERALLQAIVPAYREAAESGQVELSTTPYYHPILPLLCDSAAHHEAHAGAPLPRRYRHPEDAADQIRRAIARHTEVFGRPPAGLWPSEGSLSDEVVACIAEAGLQWTASDEGVLQRSAQKAIHRDSRGTAYPLDVLYRPWVRRTPKGEVRLLFRDRALSDLIGFSYSGLEPERAAHDMLERLLRIGERWSEQRLPGSPVVGVILDGENCWEHYRDGGRVFLRALYRGLQDDPRLQGVTLREAALADAAPAELPRVHAGSWINADFSVWIGHADDRRAWDLLGDARDALERARLEKRLPVEALERAGEIFRAACGSDWCWWYGEEHSSENDVEFDRLFRRHLIAVYRELGQAAPEALQETLITTRRIALSRWSRPTGGVNPTLDGRISSPEEWLAAGVHRTATGGAMRRGLAELTAIRFGLGDDRLHLLFEAQAPALELLGRVELVVSFPGPTTLSYRVQASNGQTSISRSERTGMGWVASPTAARAAALDVLEVAIPVRELRPGPGRRVEFRVLVMEGGVELQRHPELGPIEIGLEEVMRD